MFSEKIVYDGEVTINKAFLPDKGGILMDAMIWLVIVIVLVAIEIGTLGLTTIWFAGGALVAGIASLFHANLIVQLILFFAVSIALLIFTRPVALRFMNKDRVKTNAESLIGKDAIVLEDIDNLKEKGVVRINGLEWTARSSRTDITIQAGEAVSILKIDGVKLIVRRKGE